MEQIMSTQANFREAIVCRTSGFKQKKLHAGRCKKFLKSETHFSQNSVLSPPLAKLQRQIVEKFSVRRLAFLEGNTDSKRGGACHRISACYVDWSVETMEPQSNFGLGIR